MFEVLSTSGEDVLIADYLKMRGYMLRYYFSQSRADNILHTSNPRLSDVSCDWSY